MVAKALNCVNAGPNDFCDACPQCHKTDAGTHPDVIRIGIEEDASEIKIAQVRQALQMLDLKPFEGKAKIFIIDPANAMNGAAANALLKGLEEPPENTFFILLATNIHELIMTVRSRSQAYHFAPLTLEELRASMPNADELLLRWSRGSIGSLRSMDLAVLKQRREIAVDFLETVVQASEADFRDLIAASGDLARSKNDFDSYLEMIGVVLGDLLYNHEGAHHKIVNVDIQSRLQKLADRTTADRIIRIADFVKTMESYLKSYVNRQMMTDVLALTANDAASKILNDNIVKSR
jgi:DNA polymerase-3 subunit delta'